MGDPDQGSGVDQMVDRNLRPRRASTTRDFWDPSPSATSSRHQRPINTPQVNVNTHYFTRTASGSIPSAQGGGSNKDVSESSSEGEGDQLQEVSKLEVKREKNRLKQRNLRQRRANHISQLEDQVRNLKRDCTTFRDHITIKSTIVAANETKYRSWIAGLEDALFRHGLGDEVEGLKRAWSSSIQPVPEFPHGSGRVIKGSRKGKPIVKTGPLELTVSGPLGNQISQMDGSSRRGSLSTLVQAAMVADSSHIHPPPQVPFPNHGYQHHPPDRYIRAPQLPAPPLSHPGNPLHKSQPRVPISYPGSMEALRQPPSPSRYVHRSRTIPTSARPTWSRNDSSSHHPNLPPPESEDRKRKRSLSGPTLHSNSYPSLPPIGSSSAPNSGQVIQSQFMLNQLEPPMASLPGSASRPVSRPTSSHQPSPSIPTAWNTLAPIRRDAVITSRPNTPSTLVHPFSTTVSNPSPQHMKISDLLMDGSQSQGQGGSDSLSTSVQQKSSSWPMPQVPSVKAAMPIKDLLTTGSESRMPITGPSKIAEPAGIKPSFYGR